MQPFYHDLIIRTIIAIFAGHNHHDAAMTRHWIQLMTVLALLTLLAGCIKRTGNFAPDRTDVRLDSTNLPIVWIKVYNDSIKHDERISGRMKIIYNGAGRMNYGDTVAHPGQHIEYDGYISIRHRGNSTYNNSPKKAYSIRTLTEPLIKGGAKAKVSLLGMGKDSNWALMAPYGDKSMIRDLLAFELAQPWMEFVPDGRLCELILDDVYYGVHVLSEVVSKGKHRLDLTKPWTAGDALTGDYLMEVDCNDDVTYTSRYSPVTADGTPLKDYRILFQYKEPDYNDLKPAQLHYIQRRIDQMEAAFASADFKDPEVGYRKYIDVQNFIDYQLITELTHNVDGYRLSGKFYKRRDSEDPRFKMVLWDMNQAFGNCKIRQGWRTDTWIYQSNDILHAEHDVYLVPFWWYRLNCDPEYTAQLKARWAQYRQSNMTNERVLATVDSLALMLTSHGAEQRNSQAWPRWGVWVWNNYYVANSFDEEIAFIKQWLLARLAWMDEELGYNN